MNGATAASADALVDALAATSIGDTFNQYRCSDGDDCGPEAPAIRGANLRAYLTRRRDAPVLLVAEAAGWRGARYSGLCLYSERQFGPHEPELRRSSRHPGGWGEASATVVQGAIAPWRDRVVLWNLVPTHPRRDDSPHSNRTPTRAEMRLGEVWLERIIEVVRPLHVAGIGVHAGRALGAGVPVVRHPAHGGALVARESLCALLSGWLS